MSNYTVTKTVAHAAKNGRVGISIEEQTDSSHNPTNNISEVIGRGFLRELGLDSKQDLWAKVNRGAAGPVLVLGSGKTEIDVRVLVPSGNGPGPLPAVPADPDAALQALLPHLEPDVRGRIEAALAGGMVGQEGRGAIRSIADLESVFAHPEPIRYLIEPELPERSIVYLAGDSESGKTTLACAWARDLVRRGHGVLLLDRDRNPRAVIRERMERLGTAAADTFPVWDGQQAEETPQPDSPIVLDWCRTQAQTTGKSPLVIVDSLISFLLPGEDENSSVAMRGLFTRCRAVNRVGGTVVLIHHFGRNGSPRGSSDFRPAGDQGFLVTNKSKSRLLERICLEVDRSRYGLITGITYRYADGRMVRTTPSSISPTSTPSSSSPAPAPTPAADDQADEKITQTLTELLAANPGVTGRRFAELAKPISRPKAKAFLEAGVDDCTIRREGDGDHGKPYLYFVNRESRS